MICRCRRCSRIALFERLARSRSRNNTCPDVGSIKRRIARPRVDLPQPDSPTKPSVSPARMSRETPSTALTIDGELPNHEEPAKGKCTLRSRMEIRLLASLSIKPLLATRQTLHRQSGRAKNVHSSIAQTAEIRAGKSLQLVHIAARKDNHLANAQDRSEEHTSELQSRGQ